MNIQENESEVLRKRRTFWDDPEIGKRLDALPGTREKSYVIRQALRQYFGITSASTNSITQDAAQIVAKELMRNLKFK